VLDSPLDIDLLASQELETSFAGTPPSSWEIDRRRSVLIRLDSDDPIPQIFVGDPTRELGGMAASTGDTFTGWGASRGIYEGPARVVTKATEPIRPGDILVARTTDPSWTPLFLTAGAIVVEEGGPLSHAAIIARELGLPAVLNVPGLVSRLNQEGPVTLRVDGDRGIVVVMDAADRVDPVESLEVVA
jgi:pyruvate,water dikinase